MFLRKENEIHDSADDWATITSMDITVCNRQRTINRRRVAFTPNGLAPPHRMISSCKGQFAFGCVMSNPEPTKAMVLPPASKQP